MHITLDICEYDDEANLPDIALLTISNKDASFIKTVGLNIDDAWELAAKMEHYLNKEMKVTRNEKMRVYYYHIHNFFSSEGL